MHVTGVKRKERKKYPVYTFSEDVQHYEIFWKINELNLTNYKDELNASTN